MNHGNRIDDRHAKSEEQGEGGDDDDVFRDSDSCVFPSLGGLLDSSYFLTQFGMDVHWILNTFDLDESCLLNVSSLYTVANVAKE